MRTVRGVGGPGDARWVDRDAGPLVRPYAVTNGRSEPSHDLDLLSIVERTGRSGRWLGPEHDQALRLCRVPVSVALVAARLEQTINVTKIVLSDLIDYELVTARPPEPMADPNDVGVLEVIARGLRAL